MTGLRITVKDLDEPSTAEIRQIGIQADGRWLSKLYRFSSNREDQFLHAPPSHLAFWVLDNWWRIFHEPEPPGAVTAEWLLAHEMSSIGGGYAWPPIRLWGEGDQVGIRMRPEYCDSPAPVRFEASHIGVIPAVHVEAGFDAFLDRVREHATDDSATLLDLHRQVRRERGDPGIALWRTVEAKLGFDVDEAPAELMGRLAELIDELGQEAVSEACISRQGIGVAQALEKGLRAVGDSRTKLDLSTAVAAAESHPAEDSSSCLVRSARTPPWKLAEDVAGRLRESLAVPAGPVPNWRLQNLVGVSAHHFYRIRSFRSIPYGVRRRDSAQSTSTVALRASRPAAKRFELCRVLGDAIWSGNDRLGLISSANSARQKFQRAFAQSFLCPFRDLLDYVGTDSPTPDDVTAAAHWFRVSERVIQTTLANKGVIDQEQFEQMVAAGETTDAPFVPAYA
ncbi:MAG: hypothetical protein OXN89_23270 [Bryobacterales bacterium]|nr:hypothetical protein [Bryobacterales bacterium]